MESDKPKTLEMAFTIRIEKPKPEEKRSDSPETP